MHVRTLAALCVSALLGSAADAAAQQVINQQTVIAGPGEGPMQMLPPGRQAKTGTSVLRGRVVSVDSGTSVRRAQVRISGPDIGSKGALTDADGRYEFRDLPAGRFNLSVIKSGYVTMQYGQRRPFEPGRPIELADGQVMEKVDVALPRGSVLAGRVVDEFGEPVADANVSAMRMQFVNGRRRLVNVGRNAQSNDLGQYRLYGLAPGEYYVTATLRSMDSFVMDLVSGSQGGPTGSNNNSGYAPTYYPGTATPAEAQRVSVAVGQELASVDIGLQPVRLVKISGSALSADGKPMANAMVMLIPNTRDAMMFMPGGTSRTNASGQFTLNNVAPGEYTLQMRSMGAIMSEVAGAASMVFSMRTEDTPAGPASQQEAEFANVPLTVSGEDVNGLVVTATRGAHASGRLVFDGGGKPEGANTVRIMAPSAETDGGPTVSSMPAPVKDNGTFEVSGLVGTRLMRPTNLPKGWYLRSVRVDGTDVTDTGVEFKPGEDVSGIEVHLTQQTTTLTGSVTDDRGDAVKDYTVIVFAADPQKWSMPGNRWISSARPDQSGQFRVSNLPAGSYYAIAVEYVAQGEWSDPDWLQRAKDKGTTFTLTDGGSKALDLKLAPM